MPRFSARPSRRVVVVIRYDLGELMAWRQE